MPFWLTQSSCPNKTINLVVLRSLMAQMSINGDSNDLRDISLTLFYAEGLWSSQDGKGMMYWFHRWIQLMVFLLQRSE